jgi:F-type H+-transporting ATPase subunit delta
MAEISTLARPYAQAIFNLASANKTLKKWSDSLQLLTEVISNQSLIEIINNPNINNQQCITLLVDICGDHLDQQALNFIKLTTENNRLEVIPEIAQQFAIMCAEQEGSIEAQVISTYAINATQKKSIIAALKIKLDREVTITTTIDRSLLGGVIIRAGDMVIDGSVKTQLEKITHSLLS